MNCRLPIHVDQPGVGGFIAFPGGTFIADPRSAVPLPSPPAGYTPGMGGPAITPGGLTYVQAYDRWLPVDRRAVAPGGSKYAYVWYGAPGIYVVDVKAGTTTELGDAHAWNFVAIDSTAVYASIFGAAGQPSAGLWRLPFSGTPSQIVATGYWQAVGGGAAYGTDTSAVPQGVANVILRMDLATGATQPWFTVENASSTVVGFDSAGHPLIETNVALGSYFGTIQNLWVVSGLGQAEVIATSTYAAYNFNWYNFASDQHGFWFGGANIYLVVPGQGVFTMSSYSAALAGPCL